MATNPQPPPPHGWHMIDIKLYAKSERDLDLSTVEHQSYYPGWHIWKMEPRDERIPRVAGNWWWGTPGSIMGGQTPAWHVRSPKWGSDKYQKILPADGKGCTQRKYQHTSHGRTSASSEHQSNGGIYHTRPSSSSRPLATYCIYIYLYIQNIDAPHFLLLWKPCHPLCQTQQGSLQSN